MIENGIAKGGKELAKAYYPDTPNIVGPAGSSAMKGRSGAVLDERRAFRGPAERKITYA